MSSSTAVESLSGQSCECRVGGQGTKGGASFDGRHRRRETSAVNALRGQVAQLPSAKTTRDATGSRHLGPTDLLSRA